MVSAVEQLAKNANWGALAKATELSASAIVAKNPSRYAMIFPFQ